MSANSGEIQVLGVNEIKGNEVIELRFIQGRNPDWVHRPFIAEYNDQATWLGDLKPAFGERQFFFEAEMEDFYRENLQSSHAEDYE